MNTGEIAAWGYSLSALLFLLLGALLLTRWRDRPKSPILALASFVTLVWAGIEAVDAGSPAELTDVVVITEFLRGIVWTTVLVLILGALETTRRVRTTARWTAVALGIAAVVAALLFRARGSPTPAETVQAVGGLLLGMLIVVLAEQVFRNTATQTVSGLRYFCLAIACMFLYDIVLYGRTVVEGSRDTALWAARGYFNAMLVLPLLYSVRKRFNLAVDTLLSRQIVFYSFSAVGIGVVLVGLVGGEYYIRRFGGTWSEALRIVFVAGVLVAGAILVVSRTTRATARVLMTKALFQYKYDYRREWLRFIATLSQSDLDEQVPVTAVRAIAQIVNSPGGRVWALSRDENTYAPVGSWNCELDFMRPVNENSSLIVFLKEREWVIDQYEMKEYPARYGETIDVDFPEFHQDWWLIVPMLLGDQLSGFIMLLRPSVVPVLNFEDHDLLKTAGRHVATHIEQAETDRRLAEASQFGAYNRLTAFLMHDLNNLIAQQSLVVENAEKFRHNPDFLDDAIGTISHSVDRMKRLMEQLSSASKAPERKRVNLSRTINSAVKRTSGRMPVPELVKCRFDIHVQADAERLSMVFEHLFRNAQEATEPDGQVRISVESKDGMAEISITDTGSGMSQEFIRTRLFRPFDSTKGSQGMGIGVYQAREYARALGGQLEVSSEPGEGAEFRIQLPVS